MSISKLQGRFIAVHDSVSGRVRAYIAVGKASANGLVNIDQIGSHIPAILIRLQLQVVRDLEGAIFCTV